MRLILVSGKTKEFLFSPSDSAGDIAQIVFDSWPEGKLDNYLSIFIYIIIINIQYQSRKVYYVLIWRNQYKINSVWENHPLLHNYRHNRFTINERLSHDNNRRRWIPYKKPLWNVLNIGMIVSSHDNRIFHITSNTYKI